MQRDGRQFWESLERDLPRAARGRERDVARSVLLLLRQRIRPEEVQQLDRELPSELKELWAAHGIGLAEERTQRPIAELDHDEFVDRVRETTGLHDPADAAHAAGAVFGAMRRYLSAEEIDHVERQLPAGLKELWRGDHKTLGPHYEYGPSEYWGLLDQRLAGRVRARAGDVACTALAHLRGRLPPDLVDRMGEALPPDVRESWVAPEGGAEAHEPPERFIGRIAEDLGLVDLAAARHAAAAALGALRLILPPDLGEEVERALPEELKGFWQAM